MRPPAAESAEDFHTLDDVSLIGVCSSRGEGKQKCIYARVLQFYTFFGISIGIKCKMIDISKKITFYFLLNV
jgi:hypothetical protein